uniref:Uncharacterized protein n=1 Tax=Cacopsylla melanoneura TaxID=428564 RepID=A0A8D8WEE8_9HEMI
MKRLLWQFLAMVLLLTVSSVRGETSDETFHNEDLHNALKALNLTGTDVMECLNISKKHLDTDSSVLMKLPLHELFKSYPKALKIFNDTISNYSMLAKCLATPASDLESSEIESDPESIEIESPSNDPLITVVKSKLSSSNLTGTDLNKCLNISIVDLIKVLKSDDNLKKQLDTDPGLLMQLSVIPLNALFKSYPMALTRLVDYITNNPMLVSQLEKCLGITASDPESIGIESPSDDALMIEVKSKMSSSNLTLDKLLECINKSNSLLLDDELFSSPSLNEFLKLQKPAMMSLPFYKLFKHHSKDAHALVQFTTSRHPMFANETVKCLDESSSTPNNTNSTPSASNNTNSTPPGSGPAHPKLSGLGKAFWIFLAIFGVVVGMICLLILIGRKKRRQIDFEMSTKRTK